MKAPLAPSNGSIKIHPSCLDRYQAVLTDYTFKVVFFVHVYMFSVSLKAEELSGYSCVSARVNCTRGVILVAAGFADLWRHLWLSVGTSTAAFTDLLSFLPTRK